MTMNRRSLFGKLAGLFGVGVAGAQVAATEPEDPRPWAVEEAVSLGLTAQFKWHPGVERESWELFGLGLEQLNALRKDGGEQAVCEAPKTKRLGELYGLTEPGPHYYLESNRPAWFTAEALVELAAFMRRKASSMALRMAIWESVKTERPEPSKKHSPAWWRWADAQEAAFYAGLRWPGDEMSASLFTWLDSEAFERFDQKYGRLAPHSERLSLPAPPPPTRW